MWVGDTEHRARTVILAMGAEHKRLGVPGEQELGGRGVSYCATCDAAFFKDAPTMIVGGGDSAMEEAIFLSKFASKVAVVHRRPEWRASKIMLERARAQENIEFLTPYTIKAFLPGESGALDRAVLLDADSGEERELEICGALHRDRARAPVGAGARTGRGGRERVCDHGGPLHPHQPPGRVRRG